MATLKVVVQMLSEKDTKNTRRYKEVTCNLEKAEVALRSLYVQRDALNEVFEEIPTAIRVTIEAIPDEELG